MAINNISTPIRNGMCDVMVDAIDGGTTTDPNGDLQFHSAAFAALLAEVQFSNPAFGAAGAVNPGEAVANTITGANASGSGTPAVCRFRDRANATAYEGTVGTSGEDVNFNTVSWTSGDPIAIAANGTITVPASA